MYRTDDQQNDWPIAGPVVVWSSENGQSMHMYSVNIFNYVAADHSILTLLYSAYTIQEQILVRTKFGKLEIFH